MKDLPWLFYKVWKQEEDGARENTVDHFKWFLAKRPTDLNAACISRRLPFGIIQCHYFIIKLSFCISRVVHIEKCEEEMDHQNIRRGF